MKIIAMSAAALAAFAASAAQAADLPAYEAPMVSVSSFSWTGAYVGVTAGYIFSDPKVKTHGLDGQTRANIANGLRPRRLKLDGDGFTIGGTVGYNVQLDNSPVVFGVEADLSYTDVDDRKTFNAAGPVVGGAAGNIRSVFKQELEYLGTVRGRVGYAFDRILVFGTGGLAFGKVKASGDFFNNVPAAGGGGALGFEGSRNQMKYGYAVGGGVEYAVTDNISLKAEYLYFDLGKTGVGVSNTDAAPAGQAGYKSKFETDGHLVRAGLNYKFNSF